MTRRGGYYFDYQHGAWIGDRIGEALWAVPETACNEKAGESVRFAA